MDQQLNPNIQPEQPARKPQTQKPISKEWRMAAIVAVVILVVGGMAYGAYYIFRPQYTCWPYCSNMTNQDRDNIKKTAFEAETANWQTYKNEQYGFEVKYPANWRTGTDINGQPINFMPIGGQDANLVFSIYDKPLSETEASLPIFSIPGRKTDSRTNVTINNIDWIKLIIETNQIVLLTYNNGQTYTAQYSTFENVSPQIISTFKFIPQ